MVSLRSLNRQTLIPLVGDPQTIGAGEGQNCSILLTLHDTDLAATRGQRLCVPTVICHAYIDVRQPSERNRHDQYERQARYALSRTVGREQGRRKEGRRRAI